MPEGSPGDVTQLLHAWSEGDPAALEALIPLVYGDLKKRAHHCMARERSDHSMQTSDLVNEAYLRLVGSKPVSWESRAHFFGIAARVMRQILVEHARSRRYLKRGGGARKVTLDENLLVSREQERGLLELDEALTALTAQDERKGRVVELRFFGGLSVEETAEVLKVSPQTVMRDWRLAKAWLFREISRSGASSPGQSDEGRPAPPPSRAARRPTGPRGRRPSGRR
jgi:RNA polymerase sigma factor (TIGR02999 family)